MEAQRFLLIGGLAVVAYLMVLAWNEDYNQAPQPSAPVTSQIIPDSNVPGIPAADPTTAGDIPTAAAEDIPAATAASDITPVAAKTSSQLISVETDVLSLKIDPKGGDLIYAALKQFPVSLDQPDNPFVILNRSAGYTFVAQSGLVGNNGPDSSKDGRPLYSTSQPSYELAANEDELEVSLQLADGQVFIEKIYRFKRSDYLVDIQYQINNQSDATWQAGLFGQLKRDNSEDPSQGTSMGMQSFLGVATTTQDEKYRKIDFDDITDEKFKNRQQGGWIGILQHYFLTAWVPAAELQHNYQTRTSSNGENIAGFVDGPVSIAAGGNGVIDTQLYVGPKDQRQLETIAPNLELTIDYGFLWFIAQPLYTLLSFIQSGQLSIFGFDIDLGFGAVNWGLSIIILTLFVKLAFYKLSATSYRSMANMRRLAPELQRMKERFGDDRQKMSMAMMELYKKEKVNPVSGCLPILVQMPVFLALYWVLLEGVELRQAPFIFWIQDLAAMDPYFILPILMGGSMFAMQLLSPPPPDPMQAKVMKLMPIMFTFFFLWFPSGLVLYWLVNNLLSIAQQWYITRQIENAAK